MRTYFFVSVFLFFNLYLPFHERNCYLAYDQSASWISKHFRNKRPYSQAVWQKHNIAFGAMFEWNKTLGSIRDLFHGLRQPWWKLTTLKYDSYSSLGAGDLERTPKLFVCRPTYEATRQRVMLSLGCKKYVYEIHQRFPGSAQEPEGSEKVTFPQHASRWQRTWDHATECAISKGLCLLLDANPGSRKSDVLETRAR